MNELIWFLTDIDFSEEWNKCSFLGKISLLYVLFCILAFEYFSLIFIFNIFQSSLEVIF